MKFNGRRINEVRERSLNIGPVLQGCDPMTQKYYQFDVHRNKFRFGDDGEAYGEWQSIPPGSLELNDN